VEDHNARTSIGESDEEGMERRLIGENLGLALAKRLARSCIP